MNERTKNIFITGNSSGLGRGLTEVCLGRGWRVYGVSRRGCDLAGDLVDLRLDLTDFDALPSALERLLERVQGLDLVILNAGTLGEIRPLSETPLAALKGLMDINLWANKVILDWLCHDGRPVEQILMISSGASILGNKGWGGYALSKAALNMLARLYAHELPDTHITAVAPGLVDTTMMDYLCAVPDPEDFPALRRIRDARGSATMPRPAEAAERLLSVLTRLRERESGSYVDIREILDPEDHQALLAASRRS
jgi:NAD(P)-dependent dehydrogenase (short-subunit alcohol dehydrogenase family)